MVVGINFLKILTLYIGNATLFRRKDNKSDRKSYESEKNIGTNLGCAIKLPTRYICRADQ